MTYTIKKYAGDDDYSWAVFNAKDVKGMRSPIFWGEAKPLISGLNKHSARDVVKRLKKEEKKL